MKLPDEEVLALLEEMVTKWNRQDFIQEDPISIPHRYNKLQDKEISGFFSALFSWGNRKTIINKSNELMRLMDDTPHDFILHHKEADLKRFETFTHRTFQSTDVLYFISFLKFHYTNYQSLEDAFLFGDKPYHQKSALTAFHQYFFSLTFTPQRTKKHVSTPAKNATCKRLNMFLRWMVREDESGVDLGLWKKIPVSCLMIPYDVHVEKAARSLGLLLRKQKDWKAVEELTERLRCFDSADPIRYDFALFGLSKENLI
jgi:uncharacterized protein (TIGR02757 family)